MASKGSYFPWLQMPRMLDGPSSGGGGEPKKFSPLATVFATALMMSSWPAVFGLQTVYHSAPVDVVKSIRETGLNSSKAGSGLTPPIKDYLADAKEKRIYVGRKISAIFYANSSYYKALYKGKPPPGAIFQYAYFLNPFIDIRRIVPLVVPQVILNEKFVVDEFSRVAIFNGKGLPYPFSGIGKIIVDIPGALKSLPGVDLPAKYVVGPKFDLSALLKETVGSFPQYVKQNPMRFMRGSAMQVGAAYVLYDQYQRFFGSQSGVNN